MLCHTPAAAVLKSKYVFGLFCSVSFLLVPNASTRHRECCREKPTANTEEMILEVACSQVDD